MAGRVHSRWACGPSQILLIVLGILSNVFELLILRLQVDQVLAHLVRILLLVTTLSLESLIALRGSLCLLHTTLHILYELGQLPILFILLLQLN